jgi:hypothetical protein
MPLMMLASVAYLQAKAGGQRGWDWWGANRGVGQINMGGTGIR